MRGWVIFWRSMPNRNQSLFGMINALGKANARAPNNAANRMAQSLIAPPDVRGKSPIMKKNAVKTRPKERSVAPLTARGRLEFWCALRSSTMIPSFWFLVSRVSDLPDPLRIQ